ncbi:HAMP domain-containing histidine kinase [Clostridium gasigenes]|uniref:sensor histidine kinase n=1 Tax=Clostridium gasigenes TaxID=94869 RepID=UPI001C0AA860|nr:HAMP domain-containing sensor histidine kinase [Clostridium gasigenes]MBU3132076.1 HAMP domain-containing histidine kinase [Clostridium gasigenes]
MIKKVKSQNIFIKIFILSSLTFLVIFVAQWFLISSYLKKEQSNQLRVYENIVGALKNSGKVEENILRDAVLSYRDEENIRVGQAFLSKFGYKDGIEVKGNKAFFYSSKNIYYLMIIAIAISLLLSVMAISYFITKIKNSVRDLSDDIFKITYERGYKKRSENGEDIVAVLNSRINKLDSITRKSLSDINEDRKMLKELINDLSHQIKTPIASLKLYNSFLKDEKLTEEERTEFINTSTEDIERLEWFAEGLVQVARLETGIVNLNMKPYKLGETLIDAINSVYGKAIKKGINLEINEIPEVVIEHDYRWTKEAIINILDNSIKYTKPGGYINILLEQHNELTKIIIKDTGIGIAQDEIYNIFKRFYRGRALEVQRKDGSGLGLYLCRRIIEGQNGTIGVTSEISVGSVFTINLFKKSI